MGGEIMTRTAKRMSDEDVEAMRLIVSALPNMPSTTLQRWAGGVEMLAALRTEEEKPEKPAS